MGLDPLKTSPLQEVNGEIASGVPMLPWKIYGGFSSVRRFVKKTVSVRLSGNHVRFAIASWSQQ